MAAKIRKIIDAIFIKLLIMFFKTLTKIQAMFLAFNYLKIKQIIGRFQC